MSFDVVIYGGTSGAVMSAVQIKKMGGTVALVCPEEHLGGLSAGGLGTTDHGLQWTIGGLAHEFYHRIWEYYQQDNSCPFQAVPRDPSARAALFLCDETQTAWYFEPHVAEQVFENFIAEYEIPVYRGQYLNRENGVLVEDGRIQSLSTRTGNVFSAKVFLDASYEGDLMAAAGVSWTVGRESNSCYGETHNGIQPQMAIYHQFDNTAQPVDPYIEKGNPASGLLPYINPTPGGQNGDGDSLVQAYCYRMCLTNIPENRVAIPRPQGYREEDYELLLRTLEAGFTLLMDIDAVPNGKTDVNNTGPVSLDFIGGNEGYPDGTYEEREAIAQAHRDWQLGLLWTLQNHPRTPREIREYYGQWGLAADEFTDNDNWPYHLYIREARRMVSDFVMTENHISQQLPIPRPVGLGSYAMDSHHIQRYVAKNESGQAMVKNEGGVEVASQGAYAIDYGAIVPKATECRNLLVPVCVSASHIAYGSVRMEPVFMILGQSAGAAAVLAIRDQVDVQNVDYVKLADLLRQEGQVLSKDSD